MPDSLPPAFAQTRPSPSTKFPSNGPFGLILAVLAQGLSGAGKAPDAICARGSHHWGSLKE